MTNKDCQPKNSSNNAGAISALKGYRVQFLYSLFRILSAKETEVEFRPEGEFEDLDIYDDFGNVIEIIQVKDYAKALTLSNILSSKENTFIRRAIKACRNGKRPLIKLVTFSEVNSDIFNLRPKKYSSTTKVKLKELKLTDSDIKMLEDKFDYEIVNEDKLQNEIISKIESWDSFTDSKITLDLLIYWTYKAAEMQKAISLPVFKQQFDKICKFQSERISFNKIYYTLIKPLDTEIDTENIDRLQSDFYQGISATFKHILANVDVPRNDKLATIKEKFTKSNIVFIHGASGQGKSTLAYRYLHDYCNGNTVFELKKLPEEIVTINEVINALEGISKGISFPITLYIDVEPGYKEWINVLKELASKKNFNFLVTLREEDWNSIEVGDKFQFSEIELMLEKPEAEQIYNSLNQHNTDLKFVDFENAWNSFGGHGPLLEFVYLITQSESLSAKLKSQINKMRIDDTTLGKEKIKILCYVVLADCFGSKVKYKELAHALKINDLAILIDLLQNEYLIKITETKSHITGLHPVRSEIIKKILFDNEIYIESDFVLESIPFISDNTLLNYLRNAFRRSNLTAPDLLVRLKTFTPESWQAYLSIFKSPLDELSEKWDSKYSYISKSWRNNWDELSTFFKYPNEIRRLIHTTNAIESANSIFRKITKNRNHFNNEASLYRLLFLGIDTLSKKWKHPIINWGLIFEQLSIIFDQRLKQYIK